MRPQPILLTLLAATTLGAQQSAMDHSMMGIDMDGSSAPAPTAVVRVDSTNHVVIIRAGPFSLNGMGMPMTHHMERDHVLLLAWPNESFLTGYGITMADSAGTPMPPEMMHHAGMANLGRRELLLPEYQRLFAGSKETEPVQLPATIGVPMHPGDSLAIYIALHSPHGESVAGAYVTFRLPYTPASRHGNPVAVWPMHVEVNNTHGGTTAYDLPPGRSVRSVDFVMPAGGRLLAVGGHVHDYARSLRLAECKSGKILALLNAHRRADGTVTGLDRFIFGYKDDALRLEKGRCYRVTATYDNPTGRIVVEGGMASLGGPLQLDDEKDWPALDARDLALRADRDSL